MKKALSMLLVLAMVLSLAACGEKPEETKGEDTPSSTEKEVISSTIEKQSMSADAAKEYKEEIIVGMGTNDKFDPLEKMANAPDTIGKLVWNQLVQLDLETMTVLPELAKSWETISVKEYKFNLREDIVFSNGEKFTSADVAWSFQGRRAAEEANGNKALTSNNAVYNALESIECPDEHTVIFHLKDGDADFINRIVTSPYSIMCKKACEADMEKGWWIGTGGWVIDEVVLKDHWTFHRNDTSWVYEETGLTPTKKLTIKCFAESASREAALQAGEIAACGISAEGFDVMTADPNVQTFRFAAETLYFLIFNMKSSKVGGYTEEQKNFRKAIAYAIDREAINQGYFGGFGEITNTVWGKAQYGKIDDKEFGDNLLKYDTAKAQEYLQKSGVDPTGMKLTILSVTSFEDMCTLVQAMLGEAFGIECKIETSDSTTMNTRANDNRTDKTKDDFDLIVYNISLQVIGDRFHFTSDMTNSTNRAAFTTERQHELYDLALQTPDGPDRLDMYKEIQLIMNDNMAYMPWFYGCECTAQYKGVGGITWSLDTKPDYTHIYWEK